MGSDHICMGEIDTEVRGDVFCFGFGTGQIRVPLNMLGNFLREEVYEEYTGEERVSGCRACDEIDPNKLVAFTPSASKVWYICKSCKEDLQEDVRKAVEDNSGTIVADRI